MSPPAAARDAKEGFCIQCSDWLPWPQLETCSTCNETVCAEHAVPADHDCEGIHEW